MANYPAPAVPVERQRAAADVPAVGDRRNSVGGAYRLPVATTATRLYQVEDRLQHLLELGKISTTECVRESANRRERSPSRPRPSSTVSQRIVRQRRQGKHMYYQLVDEHIAMLVNNALEHARE